MEIIKKICGEILDDIRIYSELKRRIINTIDGLKSSESHYFDEWYCINFFQNFLEQFIYLKKGKGILIYFVD